MNGQVVKDGVPLTPKELEKQDKQHQEDLAKTVASREKWNADAPKRAEEAKRRTDEIRKTVRERPREEPR